MLQEFCCSPSHGQAHSDAVTELGLAIYAICLESHGYIFDQKLVRSGALLHDIARLQKHHPKQAVIFSLQLGYPEISQIIFTTSWFKEDTLMKRLLFLWLIN